MRVALSIGLFVLLLGCQPAPSDSSVEPKGAVAEPVEWAIAIHGGAGRLDPDMEPERRANYVASLERVLTLGRDRLAVGEPALGVVEAVIRELEDDPLFNAGRGAVFNAVGAHELDASIMDGETLACGAVTGVRTVRHPITLARLVMTETRHVFFSADGAEAFADEVEVERVANDWFSTERRRQQWEKRRAEKEKGTVGCVALDSAGHLAAGTSTGGLTDKKYGRIGDSPVIGAGTYADDRTVAVSCTGTGEEFIRHAIAKEISARVMHTDQPLSTVVRSVVHETLEPRDGGVIVVGRDGEIALDYSTGGMLRAAADANGRFEVAIWRENELARSP